MKKKIYENLTIQNNFAIFQSSLKIAGQRWVEALRTTLQVVDISNSNTTINHFVSIKRFCAQLRCILHEHYTTMVSKNSNNDNRIHICLYTQQVITTNKYDFKK